MKTKIFILFLLVVPAILNGQSSKEVNVLSYYSVGNSLDGELLIDRTNVLRFFPIFAMRDRVDSVHVTIYFGSNMYERFAQPYDNKKYWQVLLPKFRLGEAIQRLEVEVKIELDAKYSQTIILYKNVQSALKMVDEEYENLKKLFDDIKNKRAELDTSLNQIRSSINTLKDTIKAFTKKISNNNINGKIDSLNLDKAKNLIDSLAIVLKESDLFQTIHRYNTSAFQKLDSILTHIDSTSVFAFSKDTTKAREHINTLKLFAKSLSDSLHVADSISNSSNTYFFALLNDTTFAGSLSSLKTQLDSLSKNSLEPIKNKFNTIQALLSNNTSTLYRHMEALDKIIKRLKPFILPDSSKGENHKVLESRIDILLQQQDSMRDTLRNRMATELMIGFVDPNYSGPSVTKADIIIDTCLRYVRILYRNYKTSLRYMPALDPSERMGIFRIRYVPFPIVGTPDRPSPTLMKPMSVGSPTVFEIGLAFGDAIVPGDDFVPTEFSWKRLGVAFAITERLFSDSARVIGLALTYDFNSYGSIGIGGNFAGNEVHGYLSLGINKKAFEAVIKGLAGLFK